MYFTELPCNSGPQSFWHEGPVSRKTIFPRNGAGVGGMVQAVIRAMGSSRLSFACSPATHLLLCGRVPNRPLTGKPVHSPGAGDPCPIIPLNSVLWSLQKFTESLLNKPINVSVLAFQCVEFCYGGGAWVGKGKNEILLLGKKNQNRQKQIKRKPLQINCL